MRHLIVVLIILSGCNPGSQLSPLEMISYVESPENGLKKEVYSGPYHFELQYRPAQYIVAIEHVASQSDDLNYENEVEKFQGLYYFSVKMASSISSDFLYSGVDSEEGYAEMYNYFNNEMAEDLILVSEKDTVRAALYTFENTYGTAPYNTAVFAFEKQQVESDLKIYFDDPILGIGPIEFIIDQNDITRVPELSITQL